MGLLGTGGDNELTRNSLPLFDLTTKVARRRCFSKRAGEGSIPAASTSSSKPQTGRGDPHSRIIL